jgi:hypothetical protein
MAFLASLPNLLHAQRNKVGGHSMSPMRYILWSLYFGVMCAHKKIRRETSKEAKVGTGPVFMLPGISGLKTVQNITKEWTPPLPHISGVVSYGI